MISLEENGNVSKKGERVAEASRMVPGTPGVTAFQRHHATSTTMIACSKRKERFYDYD
jgi:hypothetical protein